MPRYSSADMLAGRRKGEAPKPSPSGPIVKQGKGLRVTVPEGGSAEVRNVSNGVVATVWDKKYNRTEHVAEGDVSVTIDPQSK